MTNKISMDKKYTFNSQEGTVLTTTRNCSEYPVIWLESDGSIRTFTLDGKYTNNSSSLVRLIEVKPSKWVNIYGDGNYSAVHHSRASADEWAGPRYNSKTRIACIEFKEGDGI